MGSIYVSTNDTNPSELFGGTWERYGQGKSLVGVDETQEDYNTVEKEGGASKVTLSVANLPSHSHSFTPKGSVSSTFTGKAVTSGNNSTNPSATFTGKSVTTSESGTHSHTIGVYNSVASFSTNGSTDLRVSGGTQVPTTAGTYTSHTAGAHTHSVTASGSVSLSGTHTHSVTAAGSVASTFSGTAGTTGNTGSGESVTIQDPYITVYMWKRIS